MQGRQTDSCTKQNIKEEQSMRGLAKKFAASVLALTLVLAVGTQCFAASWGSYFGMNEGWYEGAEGSLASQSATSWTANLDVLGWGGCWGGSAGGGGGLCPAGAGADRSGSRFL